MMVCGPRRVLWLTYPPNGHRWANCKELSNLILRRDGVMPQEGQKSRWNLTNTEKSPDWVDGVICCWVPSLAIGASLTVHVRWISRFANCSFVSSTTSHNNSRPASQVQDSSPLVRPISRGSIPKPAYWTFSTLVTCTKDANEQLWKKQSGNSAS